MYILRILTISLVIFKSTADAAGSKDWDYLMFSQRWPISTCIEWEERNPNNKCNLPNKQIWTVHGIWPTKMGTDGPYNCDSAIHFDPDQLDPILDKLKQQWTNVEGNTKPYSFWEHEWSKHGTCASVLPVLDSVYNYFKQGLDWNIEYDLNNILADVKVNPQSDGGYDLQDIYDGLVSKLQKRPAVQCVDNKSKQSLISEIRICFNKTMELIDCDPNNPNHVSNQVLGNCDPKKSVMYFGTLPDPDYNEINNQFRDIYQKRMKLLDIYRFLNFFIWFTL